MKKMTLFILALLIYSSAFADSTSFNPTAVTVTPRITDGIPIGTVITWSNNEPFPLINGNETWLSCDGQAIPAGTEYDDLRTLLGSSNLPNYNDGQFLKGSNTDIGTKVAEKTVTTKVDIPAHRHDLSSGSAQGQTINSGGASGQAITSGGAGGQSFTYDKPSGGGGATTLYSCAECAGGYCSPPFYTLDVSKYPMPFFVCNIVSTSSSGSVSTSPTSGLTAGGSIWGSTGGGSIWGTTSASGLSGSTGEAGATSMTINDVSTPKHTNVKYYIKARD